MRHKKSGIKLGRTSSHRDAMFRNMVTSLLKYDRIHTTDVKAKELRRWVDKIITLAKRGDMHARRQALAIVREKDVVHKLFEDAPKRFGQINGGYSRIVKIGRRPGDAAPMSLIELISDEGKSVKAKKKKAKSPQKASPAVEAAKSEITDTAVPSDKETGAESQETELPGDVQAEDAEAQGGQASESIEDTTSEADGAPVGDTEEDPEKQ